MVEVEHKKRKTMKKTIIFATVALATLFAFSSCQKENLENNYSENNVRVITATFESNGTKTTLNYYDNVTPLWSMGDKILILNASGCEPITLTKNNILDDGRTITFTTSLSGTLYAVYPASATTMTSCDGDIEFTIPAIQDGTFGSANICVAKGDSDENNVNLVFSNATSVLEFSQTTAAENDVLRVSVAAKNAIAGKCTATFGTDNKATISTSELKGKLIWTTAPDEAKKKYYVAIAPVETGDVNFKYYKKLSEASEDKSTTVPLKRSKIYELNIPTGDYEDSYVQIGGKKWAKYNLGATTVADSYTTCYGDLYQWGSIETLYNEFPWTSATSGNFAGKWKDGKENGFDSRSYKYYDSGAYCKYCSTDSKTILEDSDDAARQSWGEAWKMPAKDDFTALVEACNPNSGSVGADEYTPVLEDKVEGITAKGIYFCSNYSAGDNIKGLLFCDESGNKLFFPVTGNGCDTQIYNLSGGQYDLGGCWSNTLDTGTNYYYNYAYLLTFSSQKLSPKDSQYRYYGFSVRPIVSD